MTDTFDLFHYIGYVRRRWRFILTSCATAALIAVIGSLATTPQYTATARIVIEPPAGTDLRSAMAISPIYLESLKTYEEFASGDSLFRLAVEKFHLRDSFGSSPIESLKKKVLKAALVRNTRILEISATLPNARRAQELAQFVAEAAVNLNQGLVADSDRELLGGLSTDEQQARERFSKAQTAWEQSLVAEPVQDLQASIENEAELRAKVQHDVLNSEVDLADAAQREKQTPAEQLAAVRAETADARARLDEMRKQLAAIDARIAAREKLLAERVGHRERLDAERKADQTSLTALQSRLRDSRADAGYRGERLKIVDRGIVPERPTTPNLPLNVAAALLLGAVLSLAYLAFALNYQEEQRALRSAPVRLARAHRE